MKKTFYLLLATMLLAVTGMTLTACGDDNDEPSGGDIVGTWESDTPWLSSPGGLYENFYESIKTYTKFNQNNTYVSVSDMILTDEWAELTGEDKHQIEIDRGTYTISGNNLTTQSYDDETETSLPCIYSIKGNKMTVKTLGMTFTFTRVSDSLIDQYLH